MMNRNKLEVNNELLVSRFENGIKLIHPGLINFHGAPTVDKILKLPIPVYFEDDQHTTVSGNEICAEECGFSSFKDFLTRKWFEPFKKNTIMQSLANDENVVVNNRHLIVEEMKQRKDDINVHTLSVRMPWYNSDNRVVGLFGCSILLNKNPIAESLALISSLGLLNTPSTILYKPVNRHNLSKRETECLSLTIRGYSASKIGRILGLSQRTVEEYINNIKIKFGATSKAELIDITIDNFI